MRRLRGMDAHAGTRGRRPRLRDPHPGGAAVPVQARGVSAERAAGLRGAMAGAPVRIAMWSGPRNISTALMRAFENRPDTMVTDEPLYGHYLLATGLDHPGREAVIAAQPTDWQRSSRADRAGAGGPADLVPEAHDPPPPAADRARLARAADQLLPDPRPAPRARVLCQDPGDADAGGSGIAPAARALRASAGADRRRAAGARCRRRAGRPAPPARPVVQTIGIPFSERMLAWPAGRRPSDGVWAPHWYASVWRSTGFRPARPPSAPLPPTLAAIAEAGRPYYERLRAHRLGASAT